MPQLAFEFIMRVNRNNEVVLASKKMDPEVHKIYKKGASEKDGRKVVVDHDDDDNEQHNTN